MDTLRSHLRSVSFFQKPKVMTLRIISPWWTAVRVPLTIAFIQLCPSGFCSLLSKVTSARNWLFLMIEQVLLGDAASGSWFAHSAFIHATEVSKTRYMLTAQGARSRSLGDFSVGFGGVGG